MSNKNNQSYTIRELAIAAFEQINELCLRQEWLSSRKKILDLSHEMVQRLEVQEDDTVEISDKELLDIRNAIRYIQFSADANTAYWEPLAKRFKDIVEMRESRKDQQ